MALAALLVIVAAGIASSRSPRSVALDRPPDRRRRPPRAAAQHRRRRRPVQTPSIEAPTAAVRLGAAAAGRSAAGRNAASRPRRDAENSACRRRWPASRRPANVASRPQAQAGGARPQDVARPPAFRRRRRRSTRPGAAALPIRRTSIVDAAATALRAACAAEPAAPPVTFNQVRLLVAEGERVREREGVLQLGDGQRLDRGAGRRRADHVAAEQFAERNLLRAIQAAEVARRQRSDRREQDRSRADGIPAEASATGSSCSRSGEPVILRIEDSALRTVLPALQERTGQKIQR